MKRNNSPLAGILKSISAMAFCLVIVLSFSSCNGGNKSGLISYSQKYDSTPYPVKQIPKDLAIKWVDWNIQFKPTATPAQRDSAMKAIKDSIVAFVARYDLINNSTDSVDVMDVYCPCDSTLHDMLVNTTISATGLLATKPTKPPTTGAGDPVLYVFQNNQLKDSTIRKSSEKHGSPIGYYVTDTSVILAVMDTGLDSTLFDINFHNLLWRAPSGVPTIRNFQFFNNGKELSYYYDDDSFKHGSAVTTLALEALKAQEALKKYSIKNLKLPLIMVLKVLDSNRTGSTFTVSCALSYAMQNKATLVNASLGYYGNSEEADSVLLYHVNLCKNLRPVSIPIVAAAGNTPGAHASDSLCAPLVKPNFNELTVNHRFFPGCFSPDCDNVICVTGQHNINEACYYQNYSATFVSMGVITNSANDFCCSFPVSFFHKPWVAYEGSSFATPIISGQIMAEIIISDGKPWTLALSHIGTTPSTPGEPPAKKFITYKSIP